MKNILKQITDRRLDDIAEKGWSYGHKIPECRSRCLAPFLLDPGVILEIKRASPSKGDIAPLLDVEKTARAYIDAGARAISVLTEENYFKGSLEDLMLVSKIAPETVAVLRKDFLLDANDIEISYKCGADAVLLIARILETEKLLEMAEKAFSLGLSILLELRDGEAVLKAFEVLRLAKKMNAEHKVVLGVNARDLKTFAIDMLIPLKIKSAIEKKCASLPENECPVKIRVISESGVLSSDSASFTASLGFDGLLIGEAVAKNPDEAKNFVQGFAKNAICSQFGRSDYASQTKIGGDSGKAALSSPFEKSGNSAQFWKRISEKLLFIEQEKKYRPLVKICGITNPKDALFATECGADILGFIMEKKFDRHICLEDVPRIKNDVDELCRSKKIEPPLFVGVVTMAESDEALIAKKYVEGGVLDAIQFHGCDGNAFYGYEAMRLGSEEQIQILKETFSRGNVRVLIDAYIPNVAGGTGARISDPLVKMAKECGCLWLAGGINPQNVKDVIEKYKPELIDVSSGVEKSIGKKDEGALKQLFDMIHTFPCCCE